MIVGQHAAALRRRVEGYARFLDERLQLGPRLRPDDAAAGEYDRLLRLGERSDQLVDTRILAHRPRVSSERPLKLQSTWSSGILS